jgi:thiol:disulfide interchange protein DsbG
MIPRLFASALIAVLLLPALVYAANDDVPAPIAALKQQGLKIHGTFKAEGGLTGYAASYRGHPVAVYLTPDGKQAIVGTMVDGQGNDLSAAPLQRLVANPKYQNAWAKLKDATWVADGSDDAKRVIYMFTDANCPYCHKFWQDARPWVKAGKVQIRHVLVGLLKPSSLPKAAAILAADRPSAALDRSERNYNDGGIPAMSNPPAGLVKKIGQNTDLMKSLGLYATPTIFYRNANGHVEVKQGVPQGQGLIEVMGSPKPQDTNG